APLLSHTTFSCRSLILFLSTPRPPPSSTLFPYTTLFRSHLGHMFMNMHFLISGFLFYWIIIGIDPAPRKIPYLLRILLLLVVMGFHAFFGIAIMMQSSPIGLELYNRFEVPWIDTLDSDQYAGGGIAWALGEIPTLLVTVACMLQWSRDEERQE